MCINIEVVIPTIEKFLVLYPLRSGCILVLIWTTLRSLFCILFFSSAILEVLIGKGSPFGSWLVHGKQVTQNTYIVYYALIMLLLCETIILLFMIHLAGGIFRYKTHLLEHYLTCRFVMWIFEVIGLILVCLADKLLIGWYLGILFFVILESYSLIVVYSYYVKLIADEKEP